MIDADGWFCHSPLSYWPLGVSVIWTITLLLSAQQGAPRDLLNLPVTFLSELENILYKINYVNLPSGNHAAARPSPADELDVASS